jgi:hypothetical protein
MNGKPFQNPGVGSRERRRAVQRATGKKQTSTMGIVSPAPLGPRPSTSTGHFHTEAFCLMWYACECGHRERIWNSRDGVTAFGLVCPSCTEPKLHHVNWNLDQYAPNHVPAVGQRVWIDLTRERARTIAQRTIDRVAQSKQVPAHDLERITDAVFNSGDAPDLVVYGYVEAS